jgi:DNA-binding transcriptional LysR family regulator
MPKLPDFEAWAVFAKVAETGSFSSASKALNLSQATVSKAVSRLEAKLGSALLHRTSRRLSLSQSGIVALERATRLLEEGQALEAEVSAQSSTPSGHIRMTAPMSFGIAHLGPLLPTFFARYPKITVELNLSDHLIDIVEQGFDLALRISDLEDSSLISSRLCPVRILLVGSPAYFERHGRPADPKDLSAHTGLIYTNSRPKGVWRFQHASKGQYAVTVTSQFRVNNADIMRPALLAGAGLALQPEFLVWDDLKAKKLEAVMVEWTAAPIALHLVTPPSAVRPARVEALIDFLREQISGAAWARALAVA